ncbi:uncharacterized protein [Misgurnus anguillicaudatus]|uniref:uncharacterized protein isoform X1 n=1 Tax=Misgurnus anguillicaudatus TaxID=75329 RepID=UPI003CCF2AE0
MMRFILDCLRPARARAAPASASSAAERDSVELQVEVKDTSDDNEVKELKDALQKENEALQRVKTLCYDTNKTVEKLEEKKLHLREQLNMIQNLEKQEREVLDALQEKQQRLEETIQQYDAKLRAVNDNVQQLQMEVACAKAHAENMHVRIAPLQDSFEEILQVKKKLDKLIGGFITDEHSMTDMPEEADACGRVNVLEINFDHVDREENRSKQEIKEVNQVNHERSMEEGNQMQCVGENLKSSGSSSFTEITLTEVKEEDVKFRSASPQLDSSDIEEEDFEFVHPSQATNRQFDFFHPNPFIEGDVFGDDHFPKADVTECLPRDPFKGTDPFASDMLFVDITEEKCCDDILITADKSLPETVHYPLQSGGREKDYGTFNTSVNLPVDAHFKQSTRKLDRCLSMPSQSTGLKSRSNTCPEAGTSITPGQILDAVQRAVVTEAVSPQLDEDCAYKSVPGHSSSECDSSDGDVEDEEEDRVQTGLLCGLQKIITGSYTEFPLSPCDTEPYPVINDTVKTFEHQSIITSEKYAASDKDCCHPELGNVETSPLDLNNPGTLCDIRSDQLTALDAYDYKYGDMFFFTVRLDPSSPELHNPSPVCPDSNDVKKCGSLSQLPWTENSLSLESNDTDTFKCCTPKPEDTKHHSLIGYVEKCVDKVKLEMAVNSAKLESDYETWNLHTSHLTCEDQIACESIPNSDNNDQWKANQSPDTHILDSLVQDTEVFTPLKSTVEGIYSLLSNTEVSATDQLSAHEKLNLDGSDSQQHESHCSESLAVSKSDLQYFDPFSPLSTESTDCVSKFDEMYTISSHNAPRLDSGYHEVDTPTPVSQDPMDTRKYSFSLQDPCYPTSKESNSQITDPFSPKSVDTGIFDSETENCEFNYMINCQSFTPQLASTDLSNPDKKPMSFFNTVSCDVLSDNLNGSELDDCYIVCPFPQKIENYSADSIENRVIPGDGCPVTGETKPSSMASNGLSSQANNCSSVWRTSEITLPNPEMFDSVKHSVFEFSTTAFDSNGLNISKQAEDITNNAVNVTRKPDLADIDQFCSELSKMVSSRSSDTVQQSVTEMLFGSDPNTSSFYPWDFEKQHHNY